MIGILLHDCELCEQGCSIEACPCKGQIHMVVLLQALPSDSFSNAGGKNTMSIYVLYIYICIYISIYKRERDREREREKK